MNRQASSPATLRSYDPGIGTPRAAGDWPVTTLRGASVSVDVRRVRIAAVTTCLFALVGVAVALFVAGIERNDRVARLHQEGVPVEVTVSRCLGMLAGSGSNIAGYQCAGTFALDGHWYSETITETTLEQGRTLPGVAVPGDPPLFAMAGELAGEHSSATVFVVPSVLSALAAIIGGMVLGGRRRLRHAAIQGPKLPA